MKVSAREHQVWFQDEKSKPLTYNRTVFFSINEHNCNAISHLFFNLQEIGGEFLIPLTTLTTSNWYMYIVG
jgi:hypothetical protein